MEMEASNEINLLTMTQEDALREADRCLRCYRIYSVVTQLPIPGNDA